LLPRDLHPAPKGRRNEPKFLRHVLERVATLMNRSAESVAEAATQNAERLFGLAQVVQPNLL
jgi:TatD DNase family protein